MQAVGMVDPESMHSRGSVEIVRSFVIVQFQVCDTMAVAVIHFVQPVAQKN